MTTINTNKSPQLETAKKPLLCAENLTISYDKHIALENASICAYEGEVLALVGPSGCGKSSLLASINRMNSDLKNCSITGNINYQEQNILDGNCDINWLRKEIGMVFQQPNPFPLSIKENIGFPLKDHGMRSASERDEHIENVLRQTGLWEEVKDRLNKNALSLSGGQQQRLCIARALALQPKLLLLDEPCSSLDPLSTERIEELIISLKPDTTIIIVTHNLGQARRVADQVAVCWVNDGCGCIIESNNTQAIFGESENPITRAYLRSCD